MRESRKCQREQELKHVGKELVGVVLVRFERVAEMIGDAELMGGIECPLTTVPQSSSSTRKTAPPDYVSTFEDLTRSPKRSLPSPHDQ